MIELKKSIDAGKVFFGIKQTMKNNSKLEKVLLPSNVRKETIKMLEKEGVGFEFLEVSKEEIAGKLELNFPCEVFGLRR